MCTCFVLDLGAVVEWSPAVGRKPFVLQSRSVLSSPALTPGRFQQDPDFLSRGQKRRGHAQPMPHHPSGDCSFRPPHPLPEALGVFILAAFPSLPPIEPPRPPSQRLPLQLLALCEV